MDILRDVRNKGVTIGVPEIINHKKKALQNYKYSVGLF